MTQSLTPKISPKKWIVPYGTAMGILLSFLTYLKYAKGNQFEGSVFESLFGLLIIIGLIVYPIYLYHKTIGIFSVRTSLKIGLGVASLGAIISVGYMIFFSKVIEPNLAETIAMMEVEKMKDITTDLSDEEFNERYTTLKQLIFPYLYAGIIGVNLFFGFLVSFIMGALLKQNPNNL